MRASSSSDTHGNIQYIIDLQYRFTFKIFFVTDSTPQLTFTYFQVEPHSQCSWDSLTIFNGGSPGSPVIGQYCGTTSPGTIRSGSNKLAVVFLADHSVSHGGFLATWSADSSGMLLMLTGLMHCTTLYCTLVLCVVIMFGSCLPGFGLFFK